MIGQLFLKTEKSTSLDSYELDEVYCDIDVYKFLV